MTLEVIPNKTMFGKRHKTLPFVAKVNGEELALGATKDETKAAGMTALLNAYKAQFNMPVVRLCKDGSILCGRIRTEGFMEYAFYRVSERTGKMEPSGICCGSWNGRFEDYIDGIAAQYDSVS